MGDLVGILGQRFVVILPGSLGIEPQVELILPAKFDTRLRQGVVADLRAGMALGEVGRVGVPISSLEDMKVLLDGLPLGEVQVRAAKSNQKGHREPNELIALHEDVLITNGGAWHLPPTHVRWSDKQRARRDEFIASRTGLPLWGWKEPRTLLSMNCCRITRTDCSLAFGSTWSNETAPEVAIARLQVSA